MIKVSFGDVECKRCEDEYFSDMATEEMNEHNLCYKRLAKVEKEYLNMIDKEKRPAQLQMF